MEITVILTFSNHTKILAIHKVSRECVWLISITQNIQGTCDLFSSNILSTILYEDNTVCIAQSKENILKEIKPNNSHQSFSILVIFKEKDTINLFE